MRFKFIIFSILIIWGNIIAANFSNMSLSFQDDLFDDENSNIKYYEKPPLMLKNIAGEIAAGTIIGGVFLYNQRNAAENIGLAFPVLSLNLFITSGLVSGSTYYIGKIGDQTGSLYWSYQLSLYTGIVTWALGISLDRDCNIFSDGFLYYYLPGSVIGAVVGFNLTRKYDEENLTFLQFRNQSFNIRFPIINYYPSNKEFKMNLFEWRF